MFGLNDLHINISRNEFLTELKDYIQEGESLIVLFNTPPKSFSPISTYERKFKLWDEVVKKFLGARLYSAVSNNTYLNDFNRVTVYNLDGLAAAIAGVPFNLKLSKLKHLTDAVQSKIDILMMLERNSKYLTSFDFEEEFFIQNQELKMKKIFISHSHLDKVYVEKIIDMLETIGVPSNAIFCSSFEGYGVQLGENFLEVIKSEFDYDILVIFVLSKNFYRSPVCLCEMGATWVKANFHFPILIPPFDFKNIKGVFPQTNGMMINDKLKHNSLKTNVEKFCELQHIDHSVWERKRDKILEEIRIMLNQK